MTFDPTPLINRCKTRTADARFAHGGSIDFNAMQKRLRRLTLPVTAVTAALVVCAFSGGVLGTGMLGSSAGAARSRPPDPTIPVPLSSPSTGRAPSVTVPAPITTFAAPDAPPVVALPPPGNVPYIVLTPPDAGQSGPSVPSLPTVVPAPLTTAPLTTAPLAVITITPARTPTSRAAKTTATTTTATTATRTIRAKNAQTTTTLVAYATETIQALPPSAARPNVVVAGVVILADASNGASGAGSLSPPSALPTPPPTSPPTPQPTTPATLPISPLPTILITPVLTRNTPTTPSPTVPSTAPPASADSGDAPTPTDPGPPGIPTTTKPKVYVFVGRNDYDVVPPVSPRAAEVVAWAMAQVGQPYLWGGEGPGGFDCSGLSKMAWLSVGARLTHQSKTQFSETVRINVSDLEPGDLVFYGDPTHHLGIYIGDGKMVEAARQGIPVRIVPAKRRDLVGAGRVRY